MSSLSASLDSRPRRPFTWWLLWHPLCWACLVVVATAAIHQERRRTRAPQLRSDPREIRPLYDDPRVVADEQLVRVLHKTRPRFSQRPVKINFVDHALRMWGSRITFDDGALGGPQLLALLVDDRTFTRMYGATIPPLLRGGALGVGVATQEGRASVSHEDHLLGTLAELGTPLSFPVQTRQGPRTMEALLNRALGDFRLNQREYEWTTLALVLYAEDGQPWVSCEGQEIHFDRLARRLMRQEQPQGVCYGQHRLYTLTVLLRAHEEAEHRTLAAGTGRGPSLAAKRIAPLLSADAQQDVESYLMAMTQRLYCSQHEEGYWDGNWADVTRQIPDPDTDAVSRRVLATGHALEWWSIAPARLLPPRESIVRAGQWLSRTIIDMEPAQVETNYTFLTHAARALALWRGGLPAEFECLVQRELAPRRVAHR